MDALARRLNGNLDNQFGRVETSLGWRDYRQGSRRGRLDGCSSSGFGCGSGSDLGVGAGAIAGVGGSGADFGSGFAAVNTSADGTKVSA